jgi:cytochrome c biogenesis protein
MKLLKLQRIGKIFTNLKFAIIVLAILAFTSSLGSIIEQDETLDYYQQNYLSINPIYGFIDWKLIKIFGLDHIYTTWWFFTLLLILCISLISCTLTRQFPLYLNSKDYFFKNRTSSFLTLPFFVKIKNTFYLKEFILTKIEEVNFFIYQKNNLIYGYKGLIGRISPILVHFSLILVLFGSSFGTFINFKAQESLPKGELFHIQNIIKMGVFTSLPTVTTRVNDFWVEYQNNRVHQFYSNLSILDSFGNELKSQTISVNNPLRYKNIDFYQSDWNLLGIRVLKSDKIYEFPLFPLKEGAKSWVTWISSTNPLKEKLILIFDQLENIFFVYSENGKFLKISNLGEQVLPNIVILEILPSTGLLIKYDPSILLIYLGFGLLMVTACLSYLPYTQIWIFSDLKNSYLFIGCSTNRGQIKLEIEFENLIRSSEKNILKIIKKQ